MAYAVYIGQSHFRELTAKDLAVESNTKDFRFKRGEPMLVNKDVLEKLMTNQFGRFVEVEKPETQSASDDNEDLDSTTTVTQSGRQSTSTGNGSTPTSGTTTPTVDTKGSSTTTQQ